MAREITVKVYGYICPPEVDVYENLPEFEPEFLVTVNYYAGTRPSFYDPGDVASFDVTRLDYADGTPMSDNERDFWIEQLDDQIEDKVNDVVYE